MGKKRKREKIKEDFNSPQPFNFQGSPGPGNDIRFISEAEAIKLCEDPEMRKCMEIVLEEDSKDFPELFAGKPLGVMKVFQKQCVRDMHTLVQANIRKKVIDLSMKKKGI